MLTARLKRLAGSGFARNVATLAGGAALAQFLPLLASPLLTRLYHPAEFGVLAVYVAWLSNLAVLATGRYEMAIVLPDDDRRSANLMGLSLAIALALSVLCALLFWPAHGWLAERAGAPKLAPWLWLLPLSVLLAGGMQAWTNWNNRLQRYQANAGGRIAQAIGSTCVQLGLGFAGAGAGGLVFGQLAGQAASLAAQAWQDVKQRFGWRHQFSRAEMAAEARAYVEFPRVNAPNAFVAALLDTLTVTLLTVLSGSVTVGLYGLMMRVLKLPAALIGQAVGQVAFRDFAAAKNAGQSLLPLYRKTVAVLLVLSVPPFAVILLWGAPLFGLVFGAGWRPAGEMAAMLAPYILCHFVASPLGMIPLVIQRQRTAFGFTIVGNALFLGSLWAGFALWGSVTAAFGLVSAVMVGYFLVYFYWLYRAVQRL